MTLILISTCPPQRRRERELSDLEMMFLQLRQRSQRSPRPVSPTISLHLSYSSPSHHGMTVMPRSPWRKGCRSGRCLILSAVSDQGSWGVGIDSGVIVCRCQPPLLINFPLYLHHHHLSHSQRCCWIQLPAACLHSNASHSFLRGSQPADLVQPCLQHTPPLKRRPFRALSTLPVQTAQQQQKSCVNMDGTCKLQQTRRSKDFVAILKICGCKREKSTKVCVHRSKLTVDSTMSRLGIAMP